LKKLLILAYDFPPYVSVGGLRPYHWFKHLKKFGIEPIVITRQWSNSYGNHLDYIAPGISNEVIEEINERGTIFRTPYKPNLSNRILLKYGANRFKWIRKIISGYYELVQFFLPVGPKADLYHFAKKYLKENKVDVIIATGDPFVLFAYASKLSHEFNTPWIADYRDTWSQDHSRSKNFFFRNWNAYLEKKYLQNVSKITTVSTFFEKHIKENIINKSFEILLNGYGYDAINATKNISQESNILTIAFAGSIYKWHPIESFLKVCDELLKTKEIEKIRIQFYGINIPEKVNKLVKDKYSSLLNCVQVFPKTENDELVKKLAKTNALLLFNDYSIIGTKIYTYIGLKRKIILCYTNDLEAEKLKYKFYNLKEFSSESNQAQADLLKELNAGITVKDENDLKSVLLDLQNEFKLRGSIACESHGIEKYSRKIQTEKLAKIIHNLKSN
jgi:hypothetical protein